MVLVLVACSASDDIPAPRIAAISPDHAPVGAVVMITGEYFCQLPMEEGVEDSTCDVIGTVQFGTAPGTPSMWSDTQIMVEVPQAPLGHLDVSVTAKGRTSNHVDFRVD
jgi:hypothetical protein